MRDFSECVIVIVIVIVTSNTLTFHPFCRLENLDLEPCGKTAVLCWWLKHRPRGSFSVRVGGVEGEVEEEGNGEEVRE